MSLVGITQQIVPVLEKKRKKIRIHQCFGVRVNGQLCGIQLTWVPILSSHGCHCIQIISLACQVLKEKTRHSFDGIYRSSCVKLCKVMVLYSFFVWFPLYCKALVGVIFLLFSFPQTCQEYIVLVTGILKQSVKYIYCIVRFVRYFYFLCHISTNVNKRVTCKYLYVILRIKYSYGKI